MFLRASVIPVSIATEDGVDPVIPVAYKSLRNAYHTSEQFLSEYVDLDRILLQYENCSY